jgi:HPt (histidine-containing phosphotransfer) domain-containing protein
LRQKLLEVFRRDAEKAVATLSETIKNGDIKLYTTTAHAMRSALANVGENEISAMASALEEAGSKKDMQYMTENTDSFIRSLETLIETIKGDQADEPDVAEDDTTDLQEDTELLTSQLMKAKIACEEYDDYTASAELDSLIKKRWKKETSDALESIRYTLQMHSNFDEASEMIDSLLGSVQ